MIYNIIWSDFVVYSYCPFVDMVIYPATGGIVVVVVVTDAMALKVAGEEMIFDLFDSTTNSLDTQYKKEKQ